MFQLILTIMAIALFAGLTMVTANYLPAWAPAAKDTQQLAQTGAATLEKAFNLRAEANAGVAPAVDVGQPDGGLNAYFRDYYSFLPAAPYGYAWSYGQTTEAQLLADGYAGNATGGLYFFCLAPVSSGGPEGTYRGLKRAQQLFPPTQFYVNAQGLCGRPLNSAPAAYPAPIVATVFVRYVPNNP